MKKYLSILIITIICLNVFSEEKLISSVPVALNESFVPQEVPYKSSITYEQLLEDLDMAVYYLETAYAGYESMVKNDFNTEKFKKAISEKYKEQEIIETRSVFFDISRELKNYVNDVHFQVINNKEYEGVTQSKKFYYSKIFVEKIESEYLVQKSEETHIKPGDKYMGSIENLFYYPVKGKNSYIIGQISESMPKDFNISFDEINKKVTLYDDGAINSSSLIKYHEIETQDSGYVSLSSFLIPDSDSQYFKGAKIIFNKFANLYSKWKNKKNIIIDLRGNLGGRASFSIYLIYSMFQKNIKPYSEKKHSKYDLWLDKYFNDYITIESPAITQAHAKYYKITQDKKEEKHYKKLYRKQLKNPERKIFSHKKTNDTKHLESTFSGNLIILTDRNTASAAEQTAILAKIFLGDDKVYILGEKSMGCAEYWDIIDYALPNSGIYLHLGSENQKSFEICPNWHGETYGVYPDFWSLGKDLNETIFLVTNDEKMKEKLKDIENRLL